MGNDLESRVTVLEKLFVRMEDRLEKENGEIQKRLGRLERIVWTTSGSVVVAQGIFMFVMIEAMKSLLKVG